MKSNFILNIENTKLDTNSVLGNSIIELKRSGLSHKQISLKLNCSKSTVSYYCNKNVSVKREIKISKNKLSFLTKFYCIWYIISRNCI